MRLYWILVAICITERIWELGRSNRNVARLLSRGFTVSKEKLHQVAMIGFHALWCFGIILEPLLYPDMYPETVAESLRWISLAGFLIAIVLRIWTLKTLGERWTICIVTPPPQVDSTVVTSGPYRFIRHPNYVVVALEVLCLPLYGGAVWTALIGTVGNALLLWRRIVLEERALQSIPAYREEMLGKPRFFPTV